MYRSIICMDFQVLVVNLGRNEAPIKRLWNFGPTSRPFITFLIHPLFPTLHSRNSYYHWPLAYKLISSASNFVRMMKKRVIFGVGNSSER